MRRTKKQNQLIHSKRRAKQRYNVSLNRIDIKNIVEMIQGQHPDARFLDKQSHRVTKWEVVYNETKFRLCYDKHRKMIVTFLPPIEEQFETLNERS